MNEASNVIEIIMYGTSWCYACKHARKIMDQYQIPYQWIDIDQNEEGRRLVEKINHGLRSVPTILFPDGSILVEPDKAQLLQQLGL